MLRLYNSWNYISMNTFKFYFICVYILICARLIVFVKSWGHISLMKWNGIYVCMYVRGWSQKKCTRWQHCVSNDAIFPTISAVVLQNFRQLGQCNLSPGVCALGNDRALKLRLFMSQVPRLLTISAHTSKLKHYAGKLQRRSTVRRWKCVVWKLLTEAQFHAGLNTFVREGWA